jgi:hypothetical protein
LVTDYWVLSSPLLSWLALWPWATFGNIQNNNFALFGANITAAAEN